MVRHGEYVPQQGDVVWMNFSPQTGREQAGYRPAVVLSPRPYNSKVGLALVCPITTRVKGYPFEVDIPAGLEVRGVVLADQVKSMDWRARHAALICPLPVETVDRVLEKAGTLLNMSRAASRL